MKPCYTQSSRELSIASHFRVYLGVKTCEVFLCFVAIIVRVSFFVFFFFVVVVVVLRHW